MGRDSLIPAIMGFLCACSSSSSTAEKRAEGRPSASRSTPSPPAAVISQAAMTASDNQIPTITMRGSSRARDRNPAKTPGLAPDQERIEAAKRALHAEESRRREAKEQAAKDARLASLRRDRTGLERRLGELETAVQHQQPSRSQAQELVQILEWLVEDETWKFTRRYQTADLEEQVDQEIAAEERLQLEEECRRLRAQGVDEKTIEEYRKRKAAQGVGVIERDPSPTDQLWLIDQECKALKAKGASEEAIAAHQTRRLREVESTLDRQGKQIDHLMGKLPEFERKLRDYKREFAALLGSESGRSTPR